MNQGHHDLATSVILDAIKQVFESGVCLGCKTPEEIRQKIMLDSEEAKTVIAYLGSHLAHFISEKQKAEGPRIII